MSRMLSTSAILGAWSLVAFSGLDWALAQGPQGNAEVREPRPPNAALQVQNLSPALERLLRAWSQESAKITRLQGTHHRWVYEMVFNTEKRAEGVFYYEAPGKGRIDLKPIPIQKGEVSQKPTATGEPFKLIAERAERWICDGKEIWQVNEAAKQVDVFSIPQENQGQNIMDGPMPFLFGMPPEKAKLRYQLTLVSENEKQAVIEVLPRLQVDAVNWKKAVVILDKTIYLPSAVKLINPAGTTETVYTFREFEVNKENANWLQVAFGADKDPFRPKLAGYQFKVQTPQNQEPQFVPSLAGLSHEDATKLLMQMGCQVQFVKGAATPDGKLVGKVYNQNPAAKTPLQPGMKVMLAVYNFGQVPDILGKPWKDAGQKLEEAGYKVKYLPGQATTNKDLLYTVYQQLPNAGQVLEHGNEITLTVYNKPQVAAN